MAKTRQELLLEQLRKKYEGNNTYRQKVVQTQQNVQQPVEETEDGGFLSSIDDYFDQKKEEHKTWKENLDNLDLNLVEKIAGGATHLTNTAKKGVLGAFEGVVDTASGLVAKGADLVGADGVSQAITDFTGKNLTDWVMNTDAWKFGDRINLSFANMWGNGDKIIEASSSGEMLPPVVSDVADTFGSALGFIATAGVGGKSKIAQKLLTFASAGGGSLQEALNDGANLDQALSYGALSGATEVATETLLGGGTDDILSGAKKSAKTVIKSIVKDFGEEGLEEAISDVASPLYKTLTYKNDSSYAELFEEQGGIEGVVESFLLGGLSGGVLGGGNAISSINQAGGMKASELRDVTYKMADINNQIKEAYKKADFNQVKELEQQKIELQNKTADLFKEVADSIKDTKSQSKKNAREATKLNYAYQEGKTTEVLKRDAIREVAKANKTKVEFDTESNKQSTSYDPNKNTMHISDDTLKDDTKYREIIHEFAHTQSNTKLKEKVLNGVVDLEARRNELVKNKNIADKIRNSKSFASYVELGYDMDTAFDKAKDKILDEEIYANEFSKMFDSLDQFERATAEMDLKGARKLLRNVRDVFEGRKKPRNYKKAVDLLKSTIDGTRDINERLYSSEVEQTQAEIDKKVEYNLDDYNTSSQLADLANELLDKMNAIVYGSFNERSDPIYSLNNIYNTILTTKNQDLFNKYKERVELLEYYYKLAVQVNKKGGEMKGYKTKRDSDRNWLAQIKARRDMDLNNNKERIKALTEMFENQDDSVKELEDKKKELRNKLDSIDRRAGSIAESGIRKDDVDYRLTIVDSINKLDDINNAKDVFEELKKYEKALSEENDRRSGYTANKELIEGEMTEKLNKLKSYDKDRVRGKKLEDIQKNKESIDNKLEAVNKLFTEYISTKDSEVFENAKRALKEAENTIDRLIKSEDEVEAERYSKEEKTQAKEEYKEKYKQLSSIKSAALNKSRDNRKVSRRNLNSRQKAKAVIEQAKKEMQEYFDKELGEPAKADTEAYAKYEKQLEDLDEILAEINNDIDDLIKEQASEQVEKKKVETKPVENPVKEEKKAEETKTVESTKNDGKGKESKKEIKKEPKKKTTKERIVDIKDAEKVVEKIKIFKESIKVERVRKATEVKSEADSERMVKYKEKVSRELMKIVKTLFNNKNKEVIRFEYKGKSIEKVYSELFETMNGEGEISDKVDKIYEIIVEGLEIKSPDIEVVKGKARPTKTETFQQLRSSLYGGTNTETKIEKKIKEIIGGLLNERAEPTALYKAMLKAHEVFGTELEKVNKELDEYIEENFRLHEEINNLEKKITEQEAEFKVKNDESKAKIADLKRQLTKAKNDVKSLNSKYEKLSQKYRNLKGENSRLCQYTRFIENLLTRANNRLQTATMNEAQAKSQLNKYVFDDTKVEEINEMVNDLFGLSGWDIRNDRDFMLSFANQYSKGSKKAATMLLNRVINENTVVVNQDGTNVEVTLEEILSEEAIEEITACLSEGLKESQRTGNISKMAEYKLKIAKRTEIGKLRKEAKINTKFAKKKGGGVPHEFVSDTLRLSEDILSLTDTEIEQGGFREVLNKLSKDYNKLLDEDKLPVYMPDELADKIDDVLNQNGEVTLEELKEYIEVMRGLKSYFKDLRAERSVIINGKPHKLKDLSQKAIDETNAIIERLKDKKEIWTGSEWVDPRVVFERLDGYIEDGVFSQLYQMLEEGDLEFQKKHIELSEKLMNFYAKTKDKGTNYRKFLKKKNVKIGKVTGTNGQLLQWYETSTDADAREKMLNNGIETNSGFVKFENEQELNDFIDAIKEHYKLDDPESIHAEYIKVIDDFMAESSKIKEAVDNDRLGFSNVRKGKYFMIEIADSNFQQEMGGHIRRTNDMQGFRNVSYNQNRKGHKAPLKASGLENIIEYRMYQMAMYHGFGNRIDVFNYVYNARLKGGESAGKTVRERFGKNNKGRYNVDDYLNTLLGDIQGIVHNDQFNSKLLKQIRKAYSTYQLGFNPQTIFKQIGAIPSATKYIKPHNFALALTISNEKMSALPTLGQYRIYQNTYATEEGKAEVEDFRSKFMAGVSWMDKQTTRCIWRAALAQTRNADGSFNVVEAEKLFNKTMRETQQSSSALDKSALMRNKSDIVQFFTQFGSEANKIFSNVFESFDRIIYKTRQGIKPTGKDFRMLNGAMTRMLMSASVSVVVSMLFRMWREKDDEDNKVEYFFGRLINEIIDVIPFASNLNIDFTDGFNMTSDFSVQPLNDLFEAVGEAISNGMNGKPIQAFDKAIESFMRYFGIPYNNIKTFIWTTAKRFTQGVDLAFGTNIKGYVYKGEAFVTDVSNSNKAQINTALIKGRDVKAETYYGIYTDNIMSVSKSAKEELFELYRSAYSKETGQSSAAYLKTIPKNIIVDNESIEIHEEKFKEVYSKLSPKLDELFKTTAYDKISIEAKNKAVSLMVNGYYNVAKKTLYSKEELSNLEVFLNSRYSSSSMAKDIAYLAEISLLEKTETKSKKKVVQEYINKLRLSKGEKYLLYYLSGYSLNEENAKLVKQYLRQKGLRPKEINQLFPEEEEAPIQKGESW